MKSLLFFSKNKVLISRIIFLWLILSFFIYFVIPQIRKNSTNYLIEKAQTSIEFEMGRDLEHITENGNYIAHYPTLKQKLIERDAYGVLKILTEEKEKRHLDLMTVTDAQGFVITRINAALPKDDNIFLSTDPGEIVKEGNNVAGYYEGILDFPYTYMVTGRPIVDNENKMIGSLFVSNTLDNIYAKKLVDKNPIPGVQIVFYDKSQGVNGNSFSDEKLFKSLQSYFNTGSSWIQENETDKIFKINNSFYLLRNIALSEQTGILLFVPLFAGIRVSVVILFLLIFAFFTIKTIFSHIKKGDRDKFYSWNNEYYNNFCSYFSYLLCLYVNN